MNKQERKIKGLYKWKKRLNNLGLRGQKIYSLKSTGKPCSCPMCSPSKWEISGIKKKESFEFKYAFI